MADLHRTEFESFRVEDTDVRSKANPQLAPVVQAVHASGHPGHAVDGEFDAELFLLDDDLGQQESRISIIRHTHHVRPGVSQAEQRVGILEKANGSVAVAVQDRNVDQAGEIIRHDVWL